MRGFGVILAGVCVLGLLGGLEQAGRPEPAAGSQKADLGVRFEAVDLYVDSGEAGLAAWQLEVKGVVQGRGDGAGGQGAVSLVGVEGGEHAAFQAAPYYDPAALHEGRLGERIVIAGLAAGAELPVGRTRVARLHVRVDGGAAGFEVKVMAAGGADGNRITATARAERVEETKAGDGT